MIKGQVLTLANNGIHGHIAVKIEDNLLGIVLNNFSRYSGIPLDKSGGDVHIEVYIIVMDIVEILFRLQLVLGEGLGWKCAGK